MKLNNISFPYPVLGVNDDIFPLLGEDSLVVAYDSSNVQSYKIHIIFKINNSYIENLIFQGKAVYVCEIDCVKTNFRHTYTCESPEFSFEVDRRKVSASVNINCFVTAIESIPNYKNPGFHDDYKGSVFSLTPGDILVGLPQRSFFADKKFDKLQSATTFMQIRQDLDHEYTNFDFSNHTIDIKLPTDLWNIYNSGIGNSYAEVIHSSIAYNALLAALMEINSNPTKMWAQALVKLITNNPELSDAYSIDGELIHFTDLTKVATILLKDPYKRLFNKLQSLTPKTPMFND